MATPHGWDARVSARQHVRLSAYQILPADIGRPWEKYRRDRLGLHPTPRPASTRRPSGLTAELVGTRRAVAFGVSQPVQARGITSGRSEADPELEARLREVGSCIPSAARAALAPWRTARVAREAAVAQGKLDALSVRCEWCQAQPGEPCSRRRVGADGGARGNAPLASPHPSRLDLAAAQQDQAASQPAMA